MKKVLIDLKSYSLGDTLVSLPYVEKFRVTFDSEVYLNINKKFESLISHTYPNINYVSEDDNIIYDNILTIEYVDYSKNIQENVANQLGFKDWEYIRPIIKLNNNSVRPIKNKYVIIGIHSTLQMKYWNHPSGKEYQHKSLYWSELCKKLRKSGYTPVVIEKDELFGIPPHRNGLPDYCVKKIGLSLEDTLIYLQHCSFFIGLSSGLSWLAHSLGTKVAMISNFTEDWYEFDLNLSDYKRITNKNVCHGCWNLIDKDFDYGDWYACPKHKNSARQFECHTSITPDMVFEEIKEWLI